MMVQQVAFVVAHAIAGENNGDFLEVVMLMIEHHGHRATQWHQTRKKSWSYW